MYDKKSCCRPCGRHKGKKENRGGFLRGKRKGMEFYQKLYISPRIRNPRQVRQDLVRGKGHLTVYVLVLAEGPDGRPQLEIMHCANLQTNYYRSHPPLIVGIANGRQDAIEMVESLTREAYDMTGRWDAAAYLAGLRAGCE